MTTTSETIDATTTAGGLSDRIRNQWALAHTRFGARFDQIEQRAKAQWVAIPVELRAAIDRFVERIVRRLDLPTHADLTRLNERIDELHRKLAAVEAMRGAAHEPVAAAEGAAAPAVESTLRMRPDPVANKTSRRKTK